MGKRRQSGFTLIEMLAVISIISVLVSVSVPVFVSQLETSREAVDAANIRSQYAEVTMKAGADGADVNVDGSEFAKIDLKQRESEWQNTELGSNLHGIAFNTVGSPHAGGKAWVSISGGAVTIHYEGGGSEAAPSPMVNTAMQATIDDEHSQILLKKLDDALSEIITDYSSLDISSVSKNNKNGQDLVAYKVKVAADGSYTITKANKNTVNLTHQKEAENKEASKLVGAKNNNPHDYYYVAVRKDENGKPHATTNLAVKDGKVVTKQVNWRNYENQSYITSGLDNEELISRKQ